VTFKLTVAALGLVSFVLAMGVAYLLAMYFLGDGFECAVFGFKLALGFTWAYFLVIVFAEAVTSFGVEEVTDSDLDEYVKGMSDKDKEVLTNVTATDEERKFRPQGHDEAKENALLKDRLKKAMGWANLRGSEGKKEIGYFYLEDFIGIPNFLAKLVIDPFRHPIGRTLICLILFDMFDPIRWDWNLLIGMNMVVFGAYLALCLEWELKGVLVSIAAHISDLFVGAVKKTTGAIRKASAALHSSDSKKKESS
jgi:hypothetical protein